MTDDALLDEAYTRLHGTGPEFDGWLSNHAPMAADALLRLGYGAHLHAWLDAYLPRLQEAPRARWQILPDAWRDPLGDPRGWATGGPCSHARSATTRGRRCSRGGGRACCPARRRRRRTG